MNKSTDRYAAARTVLRQEAEHAVITLARAVSIPEKPEPVARALLDYFRIHDDATKL